MPIVGPPAPDANATLACITSVAAVGDANATAPTENEWWHPTVFVTSTTAYISLGVPDLTTVYDYSSECRDRWMIRHTCGDGNVTVFSMDPSKDVVSDPLYRSCQRYSTPVYSPGVCPGGFTIAEVTAVVSGRASANSTFWQASCCRRFDYPHHASLISITKTLYSGMTIGPEYPNACISSIVTPISAWALITPIPLLSSETPTPVYVYTPPATPNRTPISPISSIVSVTAGIAIADPVVVGWQDYDLQEFPNEYATSLAQKVGITLPSNTKSPPKTISQVSDDLSTGTKAGIGVGVVIGVAAIVIVIVFFFTQQRQKNDRARLELMPEMEGQGHKDRDRKWFFGGKWRNEVHAEAVPNELDLNQIDTVPNELDSRAVHVVPGSPVELDGSMLQREMADVRR